MNDQGTTKLKALVVDDYEKIRARLTSALVGLGLEVSEAGNGLEAMEALKEERGFDVVFTDIVMPQMDGFELCQAIRTTPALRGLPIVAVSTHHDTSYVVKALRLGADDYVPKPVRRELLERVIARIFAGADRAGGDERR